MANRTDATDAHDQALKRESSAPLCARELKQVLRRRIEQRRSFGVVAVIIDGDRTEILAAGDAGPNRQPLDGDTVFEIGSLTKLFTATLLSQMVEAGEADLDEPVAGLLPSAAAVPSQGGRQITLLDLATHTSALPRLPTNLRSAEPDDPLVGYSVDALYEFLSGYTLPRPIGSAYEYSNVGYGVLGHALAHRAGVAYDTLLHQRLLEPLGMDMTGTSPSVPVDRTAAPHDEAGSVVPIMHFGALAASGALCSTANDMARFAAANIHTTRSPLQRAVAATHTVHRAVGKMRVGLGWHIRRVTDWDAVWHSGETRGSRSFIALHLASARSVVLLSNSSGRMEDVGFHTLDPRVKLEEERPHIQMRPEEQNRYVGIYDLPDNGTVVVSLRDGLLVAKATGLGGAPIYPVSETEFFVKVIPIELTFELDRAGTPTAVTVRFHGSKMHGRKRG